MIRENLIIPAAISAADENKAGISCELALPDRTPETKLRAFTIIVHGFGSSKESPTAQMMLNDLASAGIGAIAYDQPAHGTEDSLLIPLTVKNCIDCLRTIESYIAERFCFPRIFYFASSFGAYITLTMLSRYTHLGDKAFLRSAAVNMPDLFTRKADPGILEQLDEHGHFIIKDAGPAPVRITKQFFDDMKNGDLFKICGEAIREGRLNSSDIMMIHGEKDMIIDPQAARRFAAENEIPISFLSGEDHTLSTDPSSPGKVSAAALSFFDEF